FPSPSSSTKPSNWRSGSPPTTPVASSTESSLRSPRLRVARLEATGPERDRLLASAGMGSLVARLQGARRRYVARVVTPRVHDPVWRGQAGYVMATIGLL